MSSAATVFDPTIVTAVLHHMNDDHVDDNVLIARAFGNPAAHQARMTHVDGHAGYWSYSSAALLEADDADARGDETHGADAPVAEHTVRVEWSTPITERPEIRREIVTLYDRACIELGLTPRPHE